MQIAAAPTRGITVPMHHSPSEQDKQGFRKFGLTGAGIALPVGLGVGVAMTRGMPMAERVPLAFVAALMVTGMGAIAGMVAHPSNRPG